MIYKYKCVHTIPPSDFTCGKYYDIDTEKRTFNCDTASNYWISIVNNGKFNPDPKTWGLFHSTFVLMQDKKIVIKQQGDKVIAKCGNKKGVANCHEEDNFDYYTGARIALARMFGRTVEVEEVEKEKLPKKKPPKFKAGDYVRITFPGGMYTTFTDFFLEHALPDDWKVRYAYNLAKELEYDSFVSKFTGRICKVLYAEDECPVVGYLRKYVIGDIEDNRIYIVSEESLALEPSR